jgi:5'-nucleotidase
MDANLRLRLMFLLAAAISLFAGMLLSTNSALAQENVDPTVGETAWGNYVTDAMRTHYKSDIAVIDAATLSTLASKEALSETQTRLDIAEVEVVTVLLTGRELAVVLNNAVKFFPRKNNGFLQVSGMTVHVDPSLRQDKVTGVTIAGAPLEAEKVYKIAATKFLANGGASFGMLENIKVMDGSARFVGDLIADYYGVNPAMPPVGGRYVVKD